jgi:hypothetical protein
VSPSDAAIRSLGASPTHPLTHPPTPPPPLSRAPVTALFSDKSAKLKAERDSLRTPSATAVDEKTLTSAREAMKGARYNTVEAFDAKIS